MSNNSKKILLGSQSPRRKELLTSLGFSFETVEISCNEDFPVDLAASEIAVYLAELKANHIRELSDSEVLITADTIVVQNQKVLGKPQNEEEAAEMLRGLSDSVHQVYTGICVKTKNLIILKTDVAQVHFNAITDDEINYYITNFKPFDKAGSYGIQEWIGMSKISKIEGSYYTVMGLPTHLVYSILNKLD